MKHSFLEIGDRTGKTLPIAMQVWSVWNSAFGAPCGERGRLHSQRSCWNVQWCYCTFSKLCVRNQLLLRH